MYSQYILYEKKEIEELCKNYERNNILLILTENYSPLLNLEI